MRLCKGIHKLFKSRLHKNHLMNVNNFDKICRTCTQKDNLIPIFVHNNIQYALETCMSLEVNINDGLPKHVCQKCYSKLDDLYSFRKQILYHDEIFRRLLINDQFLKEFDEANAKDHELIERNQYNDIKKENIEQEGPCEIFKRTRKTSTECDLSKIQDAEVINGATLERKNLNKTNKKRELINALCDRCGKLLSCNFTLTQHLQVHSGYKPFTCDSCDKKFLRAGHLQQHKRIHTGEKPYRCKICSKSYTQISSLIAHKRTHSGEKPHVCTICSKAFAQSTSLTSHMRTHTGEAPHKCELCGKGFASSGNLNIHRRFHSNERPFKCEQCPKRFVTVSHLKVHVNQHNGVKSHKCDICQKAFVRSTHLKEHMVTHTGDRPYNCNLCTKKYSQSGHLMRHIKKNHNIDDKIS